MEENQLHSVFKFSNDAIEYMKKQYQDLILFSDDFGKRIRQERLVLPYHMNIIDELHINENAHSRILYKLLQFVNSNGEYEILSSLVQFIQAKSRSKNFSTISVKSPLLSQEESRIDLWVRDEDYSIIFENKIYNAADQEAQLSRYIEITSRKYELNRIFVVYLSASGKEPDSQSWGAYQERFRDRYINLSFRDSIRDWLRNDVVPNLRKKDYFLQSALDQYIDYLDGLFFKRTFENKMIMKLDSFIIDHFNLNQFNNDKDKVKALQEEIDKMSEVMEKMTSLRDSFRQNIFNSWKEQTKARFPELNPNENDSWYTDVSFMDSNNKKVFVYIFESNRGFYCQIEYDNRLYKSKEERTIEGSFIESLQDILPEREWWCVWKWIPSDKYEDIYSLFCDVVERCKAIIKNT